ncbi:hypothetical protein MAC_07562 [Metarhizium acridum CQMa 102]|uniref:PA14 domain-containing protein n=1 Tax=Metarhizium acridum (strain CQMa 102) TaxID=655827 RepID=E9ECG4_METAQ|nr:uncharacterized protein MAC_07562 [Metarhizium acridum CQMa 102]EFY86417.1 hypothetical protein MAC_07562 [Metarhizium acridum CQMa 102]
MSSTKTSGTKISSTKASTTKTPATKASSRKKSTPKASTALESTTKGSSTTTSSAKVSSTKVSSPKTSTTKRRGTKATRSKAPSSKTSTTKTSAIKTSSAKASSTGSPVVATSSTKISTTKTSSTKSATTKTSTAQISSTKVSSAKTSSTKAPRAKSSTTKIARTKSAAATTSTTKTTSGKVSRTKTLSTKTSSSKASTTKMSSSRVSSAKSSITNQVVIKQQGIKPIYYHHKHQSIKLKKDKLNGYKHAGAKREENKPLYSDQHQSTKLDEDKLNYNYKHQSTKLVYCHEHFTDTKKQKTKNEEEAKNKATKNKGIKNQGSECTKDELVYYFHHEQLTAAKHKGIKHASAKSTQQVTPGQGVVEHNINDKPRRGQIPQGLPDAHNDPSRDYRSFQPSYFQRRRPMETRVVDSIYIRDDGTNLTLANAAIEYRAFLYACQDGWYTFHSYRSDDITLMWFGPKAYRGWTRQNADISQFYFGDNEPKRVSRMLKAGTHYPIRVMWGNLGSVAELSLRIQGPDGRELFGNYLTTEACDGSYPKFAPFGRER